MVTHETSYLLTRANGLPLTWGLRFLGRLLLRQKRMEAEAQLQHLNGSLYVRQRDEVIPHDWRAECLSVIGELRAGRYVATAFADPTAGWKLLPAILWDDSILPNIRGTHIAFPGATWWDVRIHDLQGIPLALAAEAYGEDAEWRAVSDYHQDTPLPYPVYGGLIFHRIEAGYLIGTPKPTAGQVERLRADLLKRHASGQIAFWGDGGHGQERISVNQIALSDIDWEGTRIGSFRNVVVCAATKYGQTQPQDPGPALKTRQGGRDPTYNWRPFDNEFLRLRTEPHTSDERTEAAHMKEFARQHIRSETGKSPSSTSVKRQLTYLREQTKRF